MTTCATCRFVYEELPVGALAGAILGSLPGYREALGSASADRVLLRPEPSTWSAVEYACHVRDVLLVQRDRVVRALVEEVPRFPPMHREQRVGLLRYAEERPAEVLDQLAFAAHLFAALIASLDAAQLGRRCVYGYPSEIEVDLAWVGRHTVHEVEHHLGDVRRVLSSGDTLG